MTAYSLISATGQGQDFSTPNRLATPRSVISLDTYQCCCSLSSAHCFSLSFPHLSTSQIDTEKTAMDSFCQSCTTYKKLNKVQIKIKSNIYSSQLWIYISQCNYHNNNINYHKLDFIYYFKLNLTTTQMMPYYKQ